MKLQRSTFKWGTYGKDGKQPLRYVLLKDMSVEHIKAILETQPHLSDEQKTILEQELVIRERDEVMKLMLDIGYSIQESRS
jgi:DNA-directed RNA polymerase subunit F